MLNLRAATATTLMAVCLYCSAQSGKTDAMPARLHVVTITEDQNGKTVDVNVGDKIIVTFVQAGGTGYVWTMERLTYGAVVVGKQESQQQHPGLPGGPLTVMFPFTLMGTGEFTLKFNFGRPWMKELPPDKTFTITLRPTFPPT